MNTGLTNTMRLPSAAARRGLRRYGLACAAAIVAATFWSVLSPDIAANSPYLIFFLAIVPVATWCGVGPALLVTLFGAIWVAFWVHGTVSGMLMDPVERVRLLLYLITGLVAIAIASTVQRARTREQEQRRASERRFRLLLDHALDYAVIFLDPEGRMTDWSPGAERLLGWTSGQAIGKSGDMIFTEEDRRAGVPGKEIQTALQSGSARDERWHQRRDGSRFFAVGMLLALRDEAGSHLGFAKVLRDFTAQREAQQALQDSEHSLRVVFNSSYDASLLHTPEGGLVDVNETFERMYGVNHEQALKLSIADISSPAMNLATVRGFWEQVLKGQSQLFEWKARRVDNQREFDVEVFLRLVRMHGRDLIMANVRDITQRKRFEAQLETSKSEAERERAQLNAVFNAVADGIIVVDNQGRTVLANQSLQRMLRDANVEEVGRGTAYYQGLFEVRDLEGRLLPFERWPVSRAIGGESLAEELKVRHKDTGQEWACHFAAEPVRDSQGRQIFAVLVIRNVTAARQAQEALRDSEERLRLFIEHAPAALAMFDREMRYLAASRRWIEDYKLTGPFLGRSHYELFPELPESWKMAHQQGLRGEVLSAQADPFPRRDGSIQYVRWEVRPWFTAHRQVGGILIAAEDVTEAMRVQEQLRASEERLRLVIDNAPLLIGYIKREMVYSFANAAYGEWFGCADSPVTGRSLSDVMGKQVFSEREPYIKKALCGEIVRFESNLPHHRLGVRHTETVYIPDKDSNGVTRGVYSFINDLTDRKRAEESLREGEERFRALAENIAQMAWMTDADGGMTWFNKRWYDYTGTSFEKMRGWGWQQVHHPDHSERVTLSWRRSLQAGLPWEDTFPLRGKDGAYRWFLSRAFPIRNAKGDVTQWFGTNTDITELREAQEALRQSEARLEKLVQERTAKLRETIGELEHFSYTITHDMRAPLRAMEAFGNLLAMEYSDKVNDTGKDYIRRIVESAKRMDDLIRDSLNYSKVIRSELPLQPMDPGALLRGMAETYPEYQPPKAYIHIEGDFPLVQANSAGLTQCISNLLNNAIKFVRPGLAPQIRVWAESIPAAQSSIGVRLAARPPVPNVVRIWFEDNGIGIPSDQLEKIFVMFQRVSQDYEGTGIGLALVRKVLHRMKGEVGVESVEGRGSRFWVELPGVIPQKDR